MVICNLYRPPQGKHKLYLEYLETCLERIDYIRNDLFIMGDVNIDALDTTASNAKELKECLSQCGLTNHIREISRFANAKNSCLDHIYSNCNIVNECGTLNVSISDHVPVFLNRKKGKFLQEKVRFTGRSYRNYNSELLRDELQSKPWDNFDIETDPNNLWQIFHDNILQTLDTLYPLKEFSIKKYKEPWVTNEHLELIRDKDLALRKAKRTKMGDDWNLARRLRNECVTKIRKAKCDFLKSEMHTNMND